MEQALANDVLRIVTVAYKPGNEIVRMARSLSAACHQPYQLVVSDNSPASEPMSSEIAAEIVGLGAVIVGDGTNLGYGQAVNRVAPGSSYQPQYFVVVNPDVIWQENSLDELLCAADKYQETAFIKGSVFGPATFEIDGTQYPSARPLPRLMLGAGHALFGLIWPGNPWSRKYHRSSANLHEQSQVGWVSGACMLIDAQDFNRIDGFDPGFFMFFEDVDLCDRLTRAGGCCVYLPQSHITHERSVSWKNRPARMIRAHHQSAARYFRKTYSRWYHAPLRLAVAAGLKIRCYLLLIAAKKR